MALTTVAQGAPYTWIVIADANGNFISSLPIGTPPPSGNGLLARTSIVAMAPLLQDPFNAGNYSVAAMATGDVIGAGNVPLVGMGVLVGSSYNRVSSANPMPVSVIGNSPQTIIEQSATITAAASGTCTLAGVVSKTTYMRGFTITAAAAAAIVSGLVTITGLTNTLNFQFDISATQQSIIGQYFGEDGIPASAVNTPVVVNVPAITGGSAIAVNAWGYQL